jgi:hypothetical protein
MSWCEENGVQFVLGMASNERLVMKTRPPGTATLSLDPSIAWR